MARWWCSGWRGDAGGWRGGGGEVVPEIRERAVRIEKRAYRTLRQCNHRKLSLGDGSDTIILRYITPMTGIAPYVLCPE